MHDCLARGWHSNRCCTPSCDDGQNFDIKFLLQHYVDFILSPKNCLMLDRIIYYIIDNDYSSYLWLDQKDKSRVARPLFGAGRLPLAVQAHAPKNLEHFLYPFCFSSPSTSWGCWQVHVAFLTTTAPSIWYTIQLLVTLVHFKSVGY